MAQWSSIIPPSSELQFSFAASIVISVIGIGLEVLAGSFKLGQFGANLASGSVGIILIALYKVLSPAATGASPGAWLAIYLLVFVALWVVCVLLANPRTSRIAKLFPSTFKLTAERTRQLERSAYILGLLSLASSYYIFLNYFH